MMTTKPTGYRNYTTDGRYWTVRKQGRVYWVVKIDPSSGHYVWAEIWGGYRSAGAAGGAAAQLSYVQGKKDAADQVRASLHDALDSIGLGAPVPSPAPVSRDSAPVSAGGAEEDTEDEDEE
jgi:hypothetical protein